MNDTQNKLQHQKLEKQLEKELETKNNESKENIQNELNKQDESIKIWLSNIEKIKEHLKKLN